MVVIGSGATAVTLVPALAERAEHVTMLQRSPTYVVSLPARDPLVGILRRRLPAAAPLPSMRWKNVMLALASFQLSRRAPRLMRNLLRKAVVRQVPAGYDVDTHFNPAYNPWDQRLCVVPDGDLFKAIGDGSVSIVTDRIDTFTEDGIQLAGGQALPADVIVTATGLNLLMLGGSAALARRRARAMGETVGYKGMMLCGIPNMVFTVGYTNSSWTLKADLVAEYVCRLLGHMDRHGYDVCTPGPRSGRAHRADHRPAGRLCAARRGLPAQAGSHRAVAPAPELLQGPAPAQARLGRRPYGLRQGRRHALHQRGCRAVRRHARSARMSAATAAGIAPLQAPISGGFTLGQAPPSPAGPAPDDGTPERLPPGIALPRALQTLRFSVRQIELVFRARRQLGEVFRFNGMISDEVIVVTSHPDHVRSLFTADPELAPSLTGESPLRPIVGPNSVLTPWGPSTCASASCCCRPFTARRSSATPR